MFDKYEDNIIITVPKFGLLKNSEGKLRKKNNEPYLLAISIDSHDEGKPDLKFNLRPFYKTRPGDVIDIGGVGFIAYGPKNPGEYVLLSIIACECDQAVRQEAEFLKMIEEDNDIQKIAKDLLPGALPVGGAIKMFQELVGVVAKIREKNGDDKLMTFEGTFLRDTETPYNINKRYVRENRYVSMQVDVLPLLGGPESERSSQPADH